MKPLTELTYYQQKLIQLLHDPAHKPTLLGSGHSHQTSSAELFRAVTNLDLRFANRAPDRLAAGADRPMLGSGQDVKVDWRQAPITTHPLQPGVRIQVPAADTFLGAGAHRRVAAADAAVADLLRRLAESREADPVEGGAGSDEMPSLPSPWNDAARLRVLTLQIWRANRDLLESSLGLPGELLPAETRVPDHPVYGHVRLAAATCFLVDVDKKDRPPAREPCLARVSVHGVQQFIGESRKTRDFWTACMVYGELVWAAMEPIVEKYGPEAILVPDLLGNPLMDQWMLATEAREAVPQSIRDAGAPTSAAPVPNTFTALLPRGGPGEPFLVPAADLLRECQRRVGARWRELAAATRSHLEGKSRGAGRWSDVWARQLEHGPPVTWTLVEWPRRMWGQGAPPADLPALPGRPPATPRATLPTVLRDREEALRPWASDAAWAAHEHLRHVSWMVASSLRSDWLASERGFDYPLVHRQLMAVHAATGRARRPTYVEEPGEKCTVTGRHQALTDEPGGTGLGDNRAAARRSSHSLGFDDGDRLGGPAALKRELARVKHGGLVTRWNGFGQEEPDDRDRTAPFPSTAGLAAGRFLECVARRWPELQPEVRRVLDAVEAILPGELGVDTQHRRALPRLTSFTAGGGDLARFLRTEAQVLSLDVLHTLRPAAPIDRLIEAVKALRGRAATTTKTHSVPGEHWAFLAMDGDGIGAMVGGDPGAIRTRWRDVLHPRAVEVIEQDWRTDPKRGGWGWSGLLDAPRGMTPSLHATITRALADFTDLIAPWVIEVEFAGRLVYAGGDDLLAMLPADEVVAAATRLQQLFSAPWVLDTRRDLAPWVGRHGLPPDELDRAWERFRVPRPGRDGTIDPRAWDFEETVCFDRPRETPGLAGGFGGSRIFPMLGRRSSLSGGAAYGHFKTPLQEMLRTARHNLELRAKPATKDRRGGHFAMTRLTRSGEKCSTCLPWSAGGPTDDTPSLARVFYRVVDGFRKRSIAGRLPYTLRAACEVIVALRPKDNGPGRDDTSGGSGLVQGAIRREGVTGDLSRDIASLMIAANGDDADAMIAPLLLARHLGGVG